MAEPVYAAGTVCWRQTKKGNIKVLLIRRVKYNDWSLPKGKVDPGETMPVTAVRETFEETGLKVSLGVNLGTINYEVPAGKGKKVRLKKTVQYWAAKIPDHVYKTYRFKKMMKCCE